MDRPRVYVETTIPSTYYEKRTAPEIVARCGWTRQWWKNAPQRYELVTSKAVLDELWRGPKEFRTAWVELLEDLPLLPIDPPVVEAARAYADHKLMPRDPAGDALHVARVFV